VLILPALVLVVVAIVLLGFSIFAVGVLVCAAYDMVIDWARRK
jgi:hypothetical protein